MAHILLGWELGGNQGHAVRLGALARRLRGQGHRLSFALQRVDAFRSAEIEQAAIWQAPLTPRLLATSRRQVYGPPTGLADILARLGMDDPEIVAAVVGSWRAMLDALRPDLVLAEFAPFLLMAARGMVPTVALGNGFTHPPAELPRLPQLVEHPPSSEQDRTLESVNAGLKVARCAPLATLPEMFAADHMAAEGFAELDPYGGSRASPLALPVAEDAPAADGGGEEVFVYGPDRLDEKSPLWAGLKAAGVPVRVHVPHASIALEEALSAFGFAFDRGRVPFDRIAKRSRLLVSHGGHGFVSSGLAAGLPQVVCHYDLEKLLNGLAVGRLDLGGHAPLSAIRAEAFGQSLVRLYNDEALAMRARAAGEAFRRRSQPSRDALVMEAVAALA